MQWNLPLYDDSVLWVVPGSHVRFNTEAENAALNADASTPLPGAIQTHLAAGDGAAYILPLMHWGSRYNANMRRTIHGGFSEFSHYEDLSYLEHLSPASQASFNRWNERSERTIDLIEGALRAVINSDGPAHMAALDRLHPNRGEKGQAALHPSFLARAPNVFITSRARTSTACHSRNGCGRRKFTPWTFQWGKPLAARFTEQEADILWTRFKIRRRSVAGRGRSVDTRLPG